MEQFSFYITLAWRNLWRNKRRTIIMLVAIVIGVWMMLATAAFTAGMVNQQLDDAIKNLAGHIQIHHPKYEDDPSIHHSMNINQADLARRMQLPGIKKWAERVRLPGIITSERDTAGVTLLGINPAQEIGLSFIPDAIKQGRYLQNSDDIGIIIGQRLADKLDTGLGKRIVLFTQDATNNVVSRGFRIVGIYHSQLSTNELQYVFTGIHTLQTMLNMGDEFSEVSAIINDQEQLDSITDTLNSRFPLQEVNNWHTTLAILYASFKFFHEFLLIWYLIVFIAMSFGMVNTILMAVYERTRELGLLQALGMQPRAIIIQIMLESLILLGIGLVVGNILALFTLAVFSNGIDLSAYSEGMESFNMSSIVYLTLQFKDVLLANALIIVLGLVTSLYPARRAAKLQPIEAITRS